MAQAVHTLANLIWRRPRYVFVQNPPFPAVWTVWLYAVLWRAVYVVDNHSAAFGDARWKSRLHLFKPFARRACANLAHNEANYRELESWDAGGPFLLQSPAVRREEILNPQVDLSFLEEALTSGGTANVLMVNRFAEDDAFREVFAAAEEIPDLCFFVTGQRERASLEPGSAPENVILTGLLDYPRFVKLMDRCDVVLTLTLRPDTLLWSIREAIALKKPFVATDNAVIRNVFGRYGLLTDHSPADMREKIREALNQRASLAAAMEDFIEEDKRRFHQELLQLRTHLFGNG
ncbi:MAG: glycosyltransferase [Candidatus Hydrogenedentota bacterium]